MKIFLTLSQALLPHISHSQKAPGLLARIWTWLCGLLSLVAALITIAEAIARHLM